MKKQKAGTVISHFITGVDLPVIPAEDDVEEWFKNNYARAAKDIHLEVDESEEIERLLGEGEHKIAALKLKLCL